MKQVTTLDEVQFALDVFYGDARIKTMKHKEARAWLTSWLVKFGGPYMIHITSTKIAAEPHHDKYMAIRTDGGRVAFEFNTNGLSQLIGRHLVMKAMKRSRLDKYLTFLHFVSVHYGDTLTNLYTIKHDIYDLLDEGEMTNARMNELCSLMVFKMVRNGNGLEEGGVSL